MPTDHLMHFSYQCFPHGCSVVTERKSQKLFSPFCGKLYWELPTPHLVNLRKNLIFESLKGSYTITNSHWLRHKKELTNATKICCLLQFARYICSVRIYPLLLLLYCTVTVTESNFVVALNWRSATHT